MAKTWLADGITDETGPIAKRTGAQIIGRAIAHEFDRDCFYYIGHLGAQADLTTAQIIAAHDAAFEMIRGHL